VIDATPDGSDVFVLSHQRLSGWDSDDRGDLYDARVDGGLPEPPPVPAPCQGESCLPAAAVAPAAAGAGSRAASPGNPKSSCPKGRVRKHGRCVKPRKHHKKRGKGRNSAKRSGSNHGGQK
jgi:hypothetical protein